MPDSVDEIGQPSARDRKRGLRARLPGSLLFALATAALSMGAGFWLRWRYLLQPDPTGWYLFSSGHLAYTDLVALYLQQGLATHPVPYVQTRLEYPVVVGAAQYAASFAPGVEGYFLASGAMLAVLGLATVGALHRLDPSARLWVFAATPPLLLYATLNWDLPAVFFAVLALLLFDRRRDGWAGSLVALGIWTKLFPAVLLLWMALQRARERDWRGLSLGVAGAAGTSLALNLPVYMANPSGWLYFLQFQRARPPDGGSLWGYLPAWPVEAVNLAILLVGGIGVAALGLAGTRARASAAEYALGSLALLALVSKVTSPQFHLWLVPFMALASVPTRLVGVFVAMDLAYFWSSFQTLYVHWGGQSSLGEIQAGAAAVANGARQLTLLAILLWAGRRLVGGRG